MSDSTFQEAIQNNYSHEQMTPLNCILSNSYLMKGTIVNLLAKIYKVQVENFLILNEHEQKKVAKIISDIKPENKMQVEMVDYV